MDGKNCTICLLPMDTKEKHPKVLPCGHTYCLVCLEHLNERVCPVDRKAFKLNPRKLPDNFAFLEACSGPAAAAAVPASPVEVRVEVPVEVQVPGPPSVRLWCRQCNAEYVEECADDHPAQLCSLKKARSETLGPQLDALQAEEWSLHELVQAVEGLAQGLGGEVAACSERLQRALTQLTGPRLQLEHFLESGNLVEAGRVALPTNALSSSAGPLLGLLVDPTSTCTLSARGGGGRGGGDAEPPMQATIVLQGNGLARLLLCQLYSLGTLVRQGDEQRQQQQQQQQHGTQGRGGAGTSSASERPPAIDLAGPSTRP